MRLSAKDRRSRLVASRCMDQFSGDAIAIQNICKIFLLRHSMGITLINVGRAKSNKEGTWTVFPTFIAIAANDFKSGHLNTFGNRTGE